MNKKLQVIRAVVLLTSVFWLLSPVRAQTLSVASTAISQTITGATLYGAITATNAVGGVTNGVSVTLFYGPTDAGTLMFWKWANYVNLSTTFTNGMVFTNVLGGLNAGAIIQSRARVQDLTGAVWSDPVTYWTNSSASTPEYTFREAIRSNLAVITIITNKLMTIVGTTTNHVYMTSGPN
jgi:hypothetical protein